MGGRLFLKDIDEIMNCMYDCPSLALVLLAQSQDKHIVLPDFPTGMKDSLNGMNDPRTTNYGNGTDVVDRYYEINSSRQTQLINNTGTSTLKYVHIGNVCEPE